MVEPPFDDDLGADPATALDAPPDAVQGALALSFALPGGLPAVPSTPTASRPDDAPRRLRLVPPLETTPAEPAELANGGTGTTRRPRASRRRPARDIDAEFGPQRTPRALLPEPKPWAGRLVQAIVEVTGGLRPVGQLVRWTTTEVYESVQRRITRATMTNRAPGRISEFVRSVHVSEPSDGIVEVSAVVQRGDRCGAIALRLEGVDGRWQCTALQVG